MTEFGPKGEVVSLGTAEPVPSYAGHVERTRRFKRIKLGLFLSSMAACIGVTLLGFVCSGILRIALGTTGRTNFYSLDGGDFFSGLMFGFQLSSWNFFLFFITVPAAWLALGLSIGRFPYRNIVRLKPYLRWGMVWGAILVGGTTGGFGLLSGYVNGLGAVISGAFVGIVAGAGCGALFHRIVRPAEQLADVDVSVF